MMMMKNENKHKKNKTNSKLIYLKNITLFCFAPHSTIIVVGACPLPMAIIDI